MNNEVNNEKEQIKKAKSLSTENLVGIILIAIFLPVIIFNLTFFIKGIVDPNNIPMAFGFAPLIVGSDSMAIHEDALNGGAFNKGDMIIIKKAKIEDLEVGDIITYIYKGEVITHRLVSIDKVEDLYNKAKAEYELAQANYNANPDDPALKEAYTNARSEYLNQDFRYDVAKERGEEIAYVTKGDYQSPAEIDIYDYQIQGVYMFRLPLLGTIIKFFQTIPGIIVLLIVPVGGYFIFELIKKNKSSKDSQEKIAELEAKLAQQASNNTEDSSDQKSE